MSKENVNLVYRAFEALQRRDIDEFVGCFDPDIEFSSLVLELEGTFHGHDGVRKWWAALLNAFPDWNPTILEVRDLGHWVLIHGRWQGSGAASGVGIDDDFWQVAEIRNRLVARYASFRTEAEALEAVGLRE